MTTAIRIDSLAYHRTIAGLSQRALARQVGVSYQVIRRIEGGEDVGNLPIRILALIAAAVHIDLAKLLGEIGHEPRTEISTKRLSRDQIFLLRRITRGEPVSQQMGHAERTVTLPSLVKTGLVTVESGRPTLTRESANSLRLVSFSDVTAQFDSTQ